LLSFAEESGAGRPQGMRRLREVTATESKEWGMLAKLFSFRGRMKRLEFLGWSVLATVLLVLALATLLIGGVFSVRGAHLGVEAVIIVVAVWAVLIVGCTWISLALSAKRIRDIGGNPTIVITAVFAITLIDALVLTRFTKLPLFWLGHQHTMVGLVINMAYGAALLLWPSENSNTEPGEPARREAAVLSRPRVEQPPLPQPSAGRREFGLRTR
jgi:uncharacterized membrane protein YhaH (DUF805 family)